MNAAEACYFLSERDAAWNDAWAAALAGAGVAELDAAWAAAWAAERDAAWAAARDSQEARLREVAEGDR